MAARKSTVKKKRIRFLVCDIDGVLTDGGMYYSESGDEFKRFNTKDGLGIKTLTARNFPVAFLSSGINKKLIQRRADLLGVQFVHVGLEKKVAILETWRKKLGLDWSEIAYIGDDVNDLEVMMLAGVAACPSDAVPAIREISSLVLKTKGGEGCVREFIDRFLS